MQKKFEQLYKLDSKGKTRVWFMEQDGAKYRTHDGILGGTVKASSWRTAKATNVGRSNERTPIAQASFEIDAAYVKQLKGAYYDNVADIHLGCRYTEPMLAETYKSFEPGDAQPKLDGARCIMKAAGGFSREGEALPGAAHIRAALDAIFEKAPNLMLDGELYNHELRENFNELMSLIKKGSPPAERAAEIEATIQYHVYDIPSMVGVPWEARRDKLRALIKAINHPSIVYVEALPVNTPEQFDELHVHWCGAGFEGSMFRKRDGLYEQGKRSKNLQKRKDFDDAEFDIIPGGIEEGEGNWAGAAKRVICWLPNADRSIDLSDDKARKANTFEAGLRGKYPANAKLFAERDQHKVVTVRFFGWTPSEIPKPRFGVATKFHGAARTL
ncbi:ATP dependent DNA ligase domain-containing protein [Sphingomonas sp. NFR04]|uniref:ATP-dependent DNA ligase n=1 Tax=Sphingomonas sp. NFR04 TaxID=1566283 RepID=UPI0008F391FD|nr:hypothetical protein [Sphingomonas sp. NFR04]SFJ46721.1 ATP dependent DNA ligase domain-containing protein [Sphingomonas sp. NFR04]